MLVQSKFIISNRKPYRITGIRTSRVVVLRIRQYKMKKCKWCGRYYTPRIGHQLYCSPECRGYSDSDHTLRRVRRFRKRYREVLKLLSYYSLGTGELGSHACDDVVEEQNKIRCEMRKLGLTSGSHVSINRYI